MEKQVNSGAVLLSKSITSKILKLRDSLFSQCCKFDEDFRNAIKAFTFDIMAFEFVARNSAWYNAGTCYG